jgi:hypothetical protein
MRRPCTHRRRGQATAEFAVGLVLFMSAIIGFLQLGRFGFANIRVAHEARGDVDEMLEGGQSPSTQPNYSTWQNGADGLAFTADDRAIVGTNPAAFFDSELVVDDLDLAAVTPDFYLVPNHMSAEIDAVSHPLYKGEGHEFVPIDPAFQRLFFIERTSISLRDDVSMPPLQIDDFSN